MKPDPLTPAQAQLAESIRTYGYDEAIKHFPAWKLDPDLRDLVDLATLVRERIETMVGLR